MEGGRKKGICENDLGLIPGGMLGLGMPHSSSEESWWREDWFIGGGLEGGRQGTRGGMTGD